MTDYLKYLNDRAIAMGYIGEELDEQSALNWIANAWSLDVNDANYVLKRDLDFELDKKADKEHTYTMDEMDIQLDEKADKSNTYTKKEVDDAIAAGGGSGTGGVTENRVIEIVESETAPKFDLKADKSETYTKTEVDGLIPAVDVDKTYVDTELGKKADVTDLDLKADKSDTYTKQEVDDKVAAGGGSADVDKAYVDAGLSLKADKSTTFTKQEVNDLVLQHSIDSFTSLKDTPNSYSGQNSKFVSVNDSGSGLVFTDLKVGDIGDRFPTRFDSGGLAGYFDNMYTDNSFVQKNCWLYGSGSYMPNGGQGLIMNTYIDTSGMYANSKAIYQYFLATNGDMYYRMADYLWGPSQNNRDWGWRISWTRCWDNVDLSNYYTKNDTYTKTEVSNFLSSKANSSTTYSKTDVDSIALMKANKSETYTKSEISTLLSNKADYGDTSYSLSLKADKSTTYTKNEADNRFELKGSGGGGSSGANTVIIDSSADVEIATKYYNQAKITTYGNFKDIELSGRVAGACASSSSGSYRSLTFYIMNPNKYGITSNQQLCGITVNTNSHTSGIYTLGECNVRYNVGYLSIRIPFHTSTVGGGEVEEFGYVIKAITRI